MVCLVGPRQAGKSTLAQTLVPPDRYVTLDEATTGGRPAGSHGLPRSLRRADRHRRGAVSAGSAPRRQGRRRSPAPAGPLPAHGVGPRARRPPDLGITRRAHGAPHALPAVSGGDRGPARGVPGRCLRRSAPEGAEPAGPHRDHAAHSPRGFPDAYARPEARRRRWFASYVTAVLERDVRELAHVEKLTAMPDMLTLLASRSASLLNLADIGRGLGLPYATLQRYVTLLQTTFLVRPMRPGPRISGAGSRRRRR